MNTYFAIKRADGRYMKIRQNGKTRNWVKNLKGASVGTEAQMQACLDVIQREYLRIGRETDGIVLVRVGESDSAWQAKLESENKPCKYEFYVRLADHTESTLATTIDDDMSEEQVRRECKNILGTWQGDCPMGVDVYRNGDYFTSEDVED